MPRSLYSPKLSDDVVRALFREGQRRRIPMTRLADELLRQSISGFGSDSPVASLPLERKCRWTEDEHRSIVQQGGKDRAGSKYPAMRS